MEISERFIAAGRNSFVREVAIPVGEDIEKISKRFSCQDEIPIEIEPKPEAFLSGLEALIGIVVFFGGWAGTKFLDEVYDAKFSPAVKERLAKYIQKSGTHKKYSLAISINKKNSGTSVLICSVGSTIEEIETSEAHIPSVLKIAEACLDSGVEDTVHMFVIDNGNCNLKPLTYNSYEDALIGLKHMFPAKMPTYLKNDDR